MLERTFLREGVDNMRLTSLHRVLAEVRRERELTQKDIATALNVEQAAVSMYETGKRQIPMVMLDRWLEMLEIEVKVITQKREPENISGKKDEQPKS